MKKAEREKWKAENFIQKALARFLAENVCPYCNNDPHKPCVSCDEVRSHQSGP